MVGVAAHICAAASGEGSRRHNPKMTPEERSHIDNGIWLCATCSVLIDRDEVRFSVAALRRMKRKHEASRRIGGGPDEADGDIIAFGADIIAVGNIISSGPAGMRVRLAHFVKGSARDLLSMTQGTRPPELENSYILLNELGYGGLLAELPTVERIGNAYEVQFRLRQVAPRRDAAAPISGICARTGQMLSGFAVFIQNFEQTLGRARGTWFARIKSGSDLSDLYWRYKDSPWFERLAMMEMIRLSSIPAEGETGGKTSTPFACVSRVDRVEVPSFELAGQKLIVNVALDIEGIGLWTGALLVFISTAEQLAGDRAKARRYYEEIVDIESKHNR